MGLFGEEQSPEDFGRRRAFAFGTIEFGLQGGVDAAQAQPGEQFVELITHRDRDPGRAQREVSVPARHMS